MNFANENDSTFRIHYKVEVDENPDDVIGNRREKMFLALAIISTIITSVLIVMVIFMRKRIKLVIVLFKEAGKAASSMPLLLFEPILVNKWPSNLLISMFSFVFFNLADIHRNSHCHCIVAVFFVVD